MNRSLLYPSVLTILFYLLFFQIKAQDLTNGLVSVWEFDETSGATIANDAFGNNDGTITTNVTTGQTGMINKYFAFTDGMVHNFTPINGGSFTFSIWVYKNDAGAAYDRILGIASYDFDVACDNAGVLRHYTGSWQVTNITVSTNTWAHLVVTYDSNTNQWTYYKDGTSGWSYTYARTVDGDWHFGANSNNGENFQGRLDQPAIWNRILTSNEILSLYNSGNGLPYSQWNAAATLSGGTASPATATIASGASPGDIICTAATGGTGTYSYQWQSSTNSGSTWTTISGATLASYTAPALTQTTWYRRKVTSGAETAYSTVSKITVTAGGGSGTVTSVALSSSDLTITGSPVTTSGTITANLATASVDATNLNDNVISGRAALASGLLSTDELFVSDGGSLKRMDVSVLESYMQSNLDFLWTENAGDISYTGGNVLVGANGAPKNLYVYGKVYSTEVVVQNSIPVPDYVFDKNYQLKPLGEVESFINKNKHLPEIPSAKEVEQNGVDLGGMNLLLLKKIEELTLYFLQQDKRIRELERASSISPEGRE